METNKPFFSMHVCPAVAAQIDKLIADKGVIFDEHSPVDNGFQKTTIRAVAVFEREGDQYLVPVYRTTSNVNPLLDRGGEHLSLSKRTIGGVLNGREDDCLEKYNANEHSFGKFIGAIIRILD